MKVDNLSPIVSWLIGIVIAAAVLLVAGVPIVFAAAFYAGHQPSDDILSKVIFLAVLLTVVVGSISIAWAAWRYLGRS